MAATRTPLRMTVNDAVVVSPHATPRFKTDRKATIWVAVPSGPPMTRRTEPLGQRAGALAASAR
jgi:hypothetical protein